MVHVGTGRSLASVVLWALLAAGCGGPTGPYTPEARFEPVVTPQPVFLAVVAPSVAGGRVTFGDQERTRVTAFLNRYRDHGRGPLRVTLSGVDRRHAEAVVDALQTLAMRNGLGQEAIEARLGGSVPTPRMVLSFTDFTLKQPECPSELMTNQSFSNNSSGSLGCAVERSIAAMVAYPADLLYPRSTEGTGMDPQRRDRVISLYRQGKVTQAEEPKRESRISGVGF